MSRKIRYFGNRRPNFLLGMCIIFPPLTLRFVVYPVFSSLACAILQIFQGAAKNQGHLHGSNLCQRIGNTDLNSFGPKGDERLLRDNIQFCYYQLSVMESSQALPESLNPCSLVRKTCQRVYSQMLKKEVPNIKLNESKIQDFIHHLSEKVSKDGVAFEPWAKYHIDPNAYPLEAVLSYTFVVDAMNFCFWPGNPAGNFEYEHMTKNLAKILHSNPECFSAEMLSAMTPEWLKQFVFNNLEFALLDERARIVREVGIVIHTFYKGSFVKYLSSVNWDAVKLVRQIAMDFTGFRDEAIYNGEQIFFYKRAQILVADLYGALSERTNPKDGQQTEPFKNLEQLTMFADYRVPQTLRLVGIMEYSPALSAKIDPFDTVSHDNELPYSSVEEVEIRAATVVAVQMIMDEISKEGTPQALKEQVKYAFQVDWLLWQMGESRLCELLPHHKVHSIFY